MFAVVLPLAIGSFAADRPRVTFRVVLVAWPASLVAGALAFLAPGADGLDVLRYNATFLDEPARTALLASIGALVVLGPATVAIAVAASRGRGRAADS